MLTARPPREVSLYLVFMYAVGVLGHDFAAVHQQLLFLPECDGLAAQQCQGLAGGRCGDDAGHGFHIDRVRGVAYQAQHDGEIGAVTLAGGAQGAVQLAFHACGGVKQLLALQRQRKHAGGPHRPHGVRAAGPDANLEEVENADGHGDDLIPQWRSHAASSRSVIDKPIKSARLLGRNAFPLRQGSRHG